MRSKAPLALMEQMVMVGVFALAAALCVQVFVFSDRASRQSEDRDRAVLLAQNAAETLKHLRGDFGAAAQVLGGEWNGQLLGVSYGADGKIAQGEAAYHLLAAPSDAGQPLLGAAEVTVFTAEGDVLFSLSVAWQVPDVSARGAEEQALAVGWEMGFDGHWEPADDMQSSNWTYGAWVETAQAETPRVSVFTRWGTRLAAAPLEEVAKDG